MTPAKTAWSGKKPDQAVFYVHGAERKYGRFHGPTPARRVGERPPLLDCVLFQIQILRKHMVCDKKESHAGPHIEDHGIQHIPA